ncbi:ATP-binding protein [Nanoarchaeota archaeon]
MAYEVIIGRSKEDREKYGLDGTVLVGKHYVKMGRSTSMSNNIYMDISRSHVVFVVGKRGSGKSYSMGAISEGLLDIKPEIKQNISIVMLDTMGVYWTMKYPNKKDHELLRQWGMKGKGLDVKIFTPIGFYKKYKEEGVPTDAPFAIKPNDLDTTDWLLVFGISENDPIGISLIRTINLLKDTGKNFDLKDIIKTINKDDKIDDSIKANLENRFLNAEKWGVFSKEGTDLRDMIAGGQITVLDVSAYATAPGGGWNVKSLVIGLIAKRLFIERMIARKFEEFKMIHESVHYFTEEKKVKLDFPLVWLVIDEAHEFLPLEGKTVATDPLITILREGRQPGISLMVCSQQPGKIHTDVMTQSDTVLAHRITAKLDTDALGALMQSYMREGLVTQLDNLPRSKGAAIIFDDENERMYPIQVRPRLTWHGGESPMAIRKPPKKIE